MVLNKLIDMVKKGSTSLKVKTIWLTIFAILIPLLIFSIYANKVINTALVSQSLNNADQLFTQTNVQLEQKFDNMKSATNMISTNYTIFNIIDKLMKNNDYSTLLEQGGYFSDLMSSYKSNSQVTDIKIFVNSETIKYLEPFSIYGLSSLGNTEIYKYALSNMEDNKRNFWIFPSTNDPKHSDYSNTISLYRISSDLVNYRQLKSVIKIDMNLSTIQPVINKGALTPNSLVFLSDGNTILTTNKTSEITANTINSFITNTSYNKWEKIKINNEFYMFKYSNVFPTDCYMVSIIPYEDITNASTRITKTIIIIIFIIFAAVFSLCLLFIRGTLRRISDLSTATKLVQKGDFEIKFDNIGNDELGNLMASFSTMSSRLSILLSEKYELGKALKNQELTALQAQINPHFLYNSLNMISCIAIKNSIPEIEKAISTLSKFYKLSLNKGKDLLSVKDEIEHVTLYASILNSRYENKIKFMLDIDELIYNFYVVKIILQPIIENSILHGILEKENREGTIKLTAKLYGNSIIFTVEDNGVGMNSDMVESILYKTTNINPTGYGLRNVNNRIQLFYGYEYGIHIESKLGFGTKVTIIIPCHDKNFIGNP